MTNSAIFFSLTKARLALSVVFSSVAGYLLAVDQIVPIDLLYLVLGGYCIVGASNSFNQIIEKDKDILMERTIKTSSNKTNYYSKSILDFSPFNTCWLIYALHDKL